MACILDMFGGNLIFKISTTHIYRKPQSSATNNIAKYLLLINMTYYN